MIAQSPWKSQTDIQDLLRAGCAPFLIGTTVFLEDPRWALPAALAVAPLAYEAFVEGWRMSKHRFRITETALEVQTPQGSSVIRWDDVEEYRILQRAWPRSDLQTLRTSSASIELHVAPAGLLCLAVHLASRGVLPKVLKETHRWPTRPAIGIGLLSFALFASGLGVPFSIAGVVALLTPRPIDLLRSATSNGALLVGHPLATSQRVIASTSPQGLVASFALASMVFRSSQAAFLPMALTAVAFFGLPMPYRWLQGQAELRRDGTLKLDSDERIWEPMPRRWWWQRDSAVFRSGRARRAVTLILPASPSPELRSVAYRDSQLVVTDGIASRSLGLHDLRRVSLRHFDEGVGLYVETPVGPIRCPNGSSGSGALQRFLDESGLVPKARFRQAVLAGVPTVLWTHPNELPSASMT